MRIIAFCLPYRKMYKKEHEFINKLIMSAKFPDKINEYILSFIYSQNQENKTWFNFCHPLFTNENFYQFYKREYK